MKINNLIISFVLAFLISIATTFNADAAAYIKEIYAASGFVNQYEKQVVNVQISEQVKNPNDSREIQLTAVINTPDRKVLNAPLFYSKTENTLNIQNQDRKK